MKAELPRDYRGAGVIAFDDGTEVLLGEKLIDGLNDFADKLERGEPIKASNPLFFTIDVGI